MVRRKLGLRGAVLRQPLRLLNRGAGVRVPPGAPLFQTLRGHHFGHDGLPVAERQSTARSGIAAGHSMTGSREIPPPGSTPTSRSRPYSYPTSMNGLADQEDRLRFDVLTRRRSSRSS